MQASAALCTREDAAAVRLFKTALDISGADRWPFDYARVQLFLGERLRRMRATEKSRKPLSVALVTFEQLEPGHGRSAQGRNSAPPATPRRADKNVRMRSLRRRWRWPGWRHPA